MKSLQFFLSTFFKNQGHYVFVSLLIGKVCAFLTSVFIIRLLPADDFGKMSIVAAVFSIFASCTGLGSFQSLLRYGSISQDEAEKKKLSRYLLRRGLVYQVILTALFLLSSVFYIKKYENLIWIFAFFAVRFLGFYFLNFVQTTLRINNRNREFAKLNNLVSIFGFIFVLSLSYFFQLKGYLISMALIPFLSLFWMKKADFKISALPETFSSKEIWRYGFHTSGTSLLSDALFSLDIILLGFLLNENAVADYRVAILIPSNVTFLALAFMQSDFSVLAKNYRNRKFLKKYITGYYRLFIPVTGFILVVSVIFSKEILRLFFSAEYAENALIFIVFMAAFLMNILFRNLYGNLLSAVGKMSVNTYGSLFSLVLMVILAYFLVPHYHILGMAVSVSISLICSGLFFAFYFHKYLKELK